MRALTLPSDAVDFLSTWRLIDNSSDFVVYQATPGRLFTVFHQPPSLLIQDERQTPSRKPESYRNHPAPLSSPNKGHAGGSIGRRSSGSVYPTATSALRLGPAHQNLEEKSEALASVGGGSSNVSVASTNEIVPSEGAAGPVAISSDVARQDSVSTGRVEASRDGVAGVAGLSIVESTSSAAASSLASGAFPAPAPAPGSAVVGGQGVLSFLDLSQIEGGGDIEEGSNAASSSWNSPMSSRVDVSEMVREVSGEGLGEDGAGGAVAGRDGGGGGGGGWLGRRGSGERERITTVVVTRVEALQVEIVEVSRAVVIK